MTVRTAPRPYVGSLTYSKSPMPTTRASGSRAIVLPRHRLLDRFSKLLRLRTVLTGRHTVHRIIYILGIEHPLASRPRALRRCLRRRDLGFKLATRRDTKIALRQTEVFRLLEIVDPGKLIRLLLKG